MFMELHIYPTPENVIEALARFIMLTVNNAIGKKGFCHFVLTGGNSPKKLYELLASESCRNLVDWSKVFFYFGDERYVPFLHKDNNGWMVSKAFFEPLQISDSRIFYIDTSLPPEAAAEKYDQLIREKLRESYPVFDLLLLGLGDNAHTASLFPGTPVLMERTAGVKAVHLDDQQVYRITMTAPMINHARAVAFLVFGETKAEAVYQVLEGEKNSNLYPAQLINAAEGTTDWFLDKDAAKLLKDKNRPDT